MASTTQWNRFTRATAILVMAALLVPSAALAQGPSVDDKDGKVPDAPQPAPQQATSAPATTTKRIDYSKGVSYFPNVIAPYMAQPVAEPAFVNTPRIESLIRDGKLYLSLNDAIALALENNLDIAIARYNLQIADTDILRSLSGSGIRGTPTGTVSGTPGGTSAASGGSGAGGTSAGSGGAGTGSGGQVTSTTGAGSAVPQFDPSLGATIQLEHQNSLSANSITSGTLVNTANSRVANFNFNEGFSPGTNLSVSFSNSRLFTNNAFNKLNPTLNSSFRATVSQHLLQGFGIANNTRLIRIARNNKKITDSSFKQQIISTVSQIQNIYWDLVSAYEDVKVKERSLALASKTLDDNKKQVEIGTLAPIEIVRAKSVSAQDQQDLIVSQTNLQLQQTFMINALSRSLSDPKIATIQVVPTDTLTVSPNDPTPMVEELVKLAQTARPELEQSQIDLESRTINKKATRNALLPTVDLYGFYGGSGLGGTEPFGYCSTSTCTAAEVTAGKIPPGVFPAGYGGTFSNLFNSTAPDKGIGITASIPIRNRSAQADQIRSELEYRQAELRLKQQQNTINIDVRNTLFTYQQNKARVAAALAARDLARESLDAEQKKYSLGASTTTLVLGTQRDLALAESQVVTAQSAYQKSKVDLDRATGQTLNHNGIALDDALSGNVSRMPVVPNVVSGKNN